MTGDDRLLGGRYQLGDVLGRGGMAEVRRAVDTRLGRPVAVKQLSAETAKDPTFLARFRREAQAVAGLNHPAIVAVYDTGSESDPVTEVSIPYIVMELDEGTTLRQVLKDGSAMSPERALELTQGILDALSYSHEAGIIHRDIKPANVMLTPTGGIKVMDFGIARAVDETTTSLTQTAAVIGTAQYFSPEQARGETVDTRSDIYATGCLLYELLVGRPPFTGETSLSIAYQHVREEPKPPSELDPRISSDIDAITLKALAKDREDRYQSAREMRADIARVLVGQPAAAAFEPVSNTQPLAAIPGEMPAALAVTTPVAPSPPLLPEDRAEAPRSGRRGLIIALAGLIVLLAVGGFAVYRLMQPTAGGQVDVPKVLGMSRAKADDVLRAAQLVPQFKSVKGSDDDSVNTVTKQQPGDGEGVPVNSTVTLEINVGPDTAKIPDGLVGQDIHQVKRSLSRAGFTNVNTDKIDSSDPEAKKDQVLSVDPAEGQTAGVGQAINVTYASGKTLSTTATPSTDDKSSESASLPADTPKPADTTRPEDTKKPVETSKPPDSSTSATKSTNPVPTATTSRTKGTSKKTPKPKKATVNSDPTDPTKSIPSTKATGSANTAGSAKVNASPSPTAVANGE
jgi:beta-lactam-binding protein with PASTA domain